MSKKFQASPIKRATVGHADNVHIPSLCCLVANGDTNSVSSPSYVNTSVMDGS